MRNLLLGNIQAPVRLSNKWGSTICRSSLGNVPLGQLQKQSVYNKIIFHLIQLSMELTESCIKYMSKVLAKYVYIYKTVKEVMLSSPLPTPVDAFLPSRWLPQLGY